LQGRALASLSEEELKSLHTACAAAADQSRALLEAWLDRALPDWRNRWNRERAERQGPSSGSMSRTEALAILGLKDGEAGSEAVRSAHKRLMKQFHPDRGGSDYLAAKINQAKDVLLQE
jgi:hypothetical protein